MSTPTRQVRDGDVVLFAYTLKNDEGETLDSSKDGPPLAALMGAGNIVPGLETQLMGRAVGDAFHAEVAPADGYGVPQGPGPQAVSWDDFPEGADLAPGMPVFAQAPDGSQLVLWVVNVDESSVWLDANHPLAGATLHFDIEIVGLREATAEEKEHAHAHGPDGHAHHHDHG